MEDAPKLDTDRKINTFYITARDVGHATRIARQKLATFDPNPDRYGVLYRHSGDNEATLAELLSTGDAGYDRIIRRASRTPIVTRWTTHLIDPAAISYGTSWW